MADLASSPYFLLILFIAAFALPLLYLIWIRNSPRYGREPWPTVLKTFAWGAVFSVIIAIILSILFILVLSSSQSLNDFFARRFQDPSTAIGALVVAPIVKRPRKGWERPRAVRRHSRGPTGSSMAPRRAWGSPRRRISSMHSPRFSCRASGPPARSSWLPSGHSPRPFSMRARPP